MEPHHLVVVAPNQPGKADGEESCTTYGMTLAQEHPQSRTVSVV